MRVRCIPFLLSGLVFCAGQLAADENPGALSPREEELVRRAVWGTVEARTKALDELRQWPVTPERVRQVEEVIRAGRTYGPITDNRQTVTVAIDDKRKVSVLVQLPPGYDPARRYPLLFAIGGGPPPDEKGATARAKSMQALWSKPADQAGWIVAVIEDTPSIRLPGKELRYFILHADHLRAVRDILVEKYAIDANRVHATGISLGSNYALAYAAAHPDWFAGIAPVSTEGESREHVVRNLKHVGVYVLEGAKDKNIRTIDGPRKMAEILRNFDYPHVYDEDANRGHEGFREKYPVVLKWLAERPRPAFPKDVIRLPHAGIVLPGKRFHWLEGDTHQAAFTAKVDGNAIEVRAARVRRLTFHLSDRLLNLAAPVVIRINGRVVHDRAAPRSLVTAVEDAALLNDSERIATARISVAVPDLAAGEKWLATLAPKVEPSRLPFWEDFAMTTLKERRWGLPAEVEAVKGTPGLPAWQTALRVKSAPEGSPLRAGDLLLECDGDPLFAGADSVSFLHDYLLRTTGKSVEWKVMREEKEQRVKTDVWKE
jgi:pimeloyl-ACP methyl ester carboxylesterase